MNSCHPFLEDLRCLLEFYFSFSLPILSTLVTNSPLLDCNTISVLDRQTLELTQQSYEGIPAYVQILTALGVLFGFIGSWYLSGTLRPLGVIKGQQ